MNIRTALRAMAGFAVSATFCLTTFAATPDQPIQMIVPTPPGSGSDALARAISAPWSRISGRPVVIENVAGAGGTIGTTKLVRSPNDGLTLAMLSANHTLNPWLYKKLPYDALADVTPILMIGSIPAMLVASPRVPADDVARLVSLAKSGKKELFEGVVSGTSYNMASELFKQQAGITTRPVPYKGSNEVLRDLLTGVIDVGFVAAQAATPLVSAGKLKGLAVTSQARTELAPRVATMTESGLPSYKMDIWLGVFGPARMSKADVAARRQELERALAEPDVQRAFQVQGVETLRMNHAEIPAFLQKDMQRNRAIVRSAGMTLD